MMIASCTNVIGLLVITITIFLVHKDQIIENNKKRLLILTLVITGIIIILKMGSVIIAGNMSAWAVGIFPVINAFGFALTPCVSYITSLICIDVVRRNHIILGIPLVIYVIACILSIWTGWVFQISEENTYARGSLFPIVYVISIYTILILLAANHYSVKDYDNSSKMHVVVMYSLVLFAVVMQIFYRPMMLTWCCVAIALMLYYAFLKDKMLRCDPLTGVRNQSAFRLKLNEMTNAVNTGVVLVRLEQYKQISELYGSAKLESYLILISRTIKEAFNLIGKTYRTDGKTFCILIENAEENKVEESLNYLKKMLDNLNEREKTDIHVLVGYHIQEIGESIFECYRNGVDNCDYSGRIY